MSILEVALRNALARELETYAGRVDWYSIFATTPGLTDLNKYITQARKMIVTRGEVENPGKITAELTLGFWTSLLNRNYERILWKDLRRAFPFMPKKLRQRKVIAAYLNRFRHLRNRIDHNEPICWNVKRAEELHEDLLQVMAWINKGIPLWESRLDDFDKVCSDIKKSFIDASWAMLSVIRCNQNYHFLNSSKPNLQPKTRLPLPLLVKRPTENIRVVKP